jgi:hypothetical protein
VEPYVSSDLLKISFFMVRLHMAAGSTLTKQDIVQIHLSIRGLVYAVPNGGLLLDA